MSALVGNPGDRHGGSGLPPERTPPVSGFRVAQVSSEQRLHAAARLISASVSDPYLAAARFLDSAQHLGIDLSLMWVTTGPGTNRGAEAVEPVRQVCLAVAGAGRTVMLFVSNGAGRGGRAAEIPASESQRERVALIEQACRAASRPIGGKPPAILAQALLESAETDALVAFTAAGFTRLGDLAYLRRSGFSAPGAARREAAAGWPERVRVETLAELQSVGVPGAETDRMVLVALERSYVETLDCPELCGMRDPADVLESHRAVGRYDPSLWWVVSDEEGPQGCMLLSVCPEQESLELVYLGVSPRMRGMGLGSRLLAMGLARVGELGSGRRPAVSVRGGVTCAVDTRNGPALRLYERAGFVRFGVRVPMVRGLRG